MFCTSCGSQLPPGAAVCPSCGARVIVPAPVGAPPSINNYLVPSILVTLCCCLPLGIVGIIFAAQVNSKLAAGNTAGAMEAAKYARLFTWIGFACGLVGAIIYVAIYGTAILSNVRH